ncbi:hypothetical protein N7457_008582 [Penicillium paradoxum]|uniref:uncharacterized protein n=1 Tax=Penicillium paradoxum TaxID=176176 RepID=UPI002549056A|nr:uncharacterized protein N7457_008582 [Penicillium paradoxum]KAJ5773686.1 hypothetical protein N7457_008582 [Penicillium paradoxum]
MSLERLLVDEAITCLMDYDAEEETGPILDVSLTLYLQDLVNREQTYELKGIRHIVRPIDVVR